MAKPKDAWREMAFAKGYGAVSTGKGPQIRFALTRGFVVGGYFMDDLPRVALADSLTLGYYRSPPSGVLIQRLRRMFFEVKANHQEITQLQFLLTRFKSVVDPR